MGPLQHAHERDRLARAWFALCSDLTTLAGAMAVIARAGVALLVLCGKAEAFFASPPQTSARTNARARVPVQAEFPQGHHVSRVELGARTRGGGAAVLRASSEEPSADVASSSARPPVDFAAIGK